jgi:hypothetical protein
LQVGGVDASVDTEGPEVVHGFGTAAGRDRNDLQMGLLVQELEDPGLYQIYRELSSNAGGNQIYISHSAVGSWDGHDREVSIGSLKIAAIQLKLPVEVLGLQSEEGEKLSLNPGNDLILTPADHIVYMSRKRFDWLKNSLWPRFVETRRL